jgi:hypothetical protein
MKLKKKKLRKVSEPNYDTKKLEEAIESVNSNTILASAAAKFYNIPYLLMEKNLL